jgi:glycosyltransferase involved in cell wall biosynthesis
MRIGLDVAQTCFERHGCGWVADRIATAMGFACPTDEVILYHQFGEWLNWSTSKGTAIGLSNVSAPFMGSSWWDARIAWKRIEGGRVNLPGEPEVVHSFSFQAPTVGNARLVYTIYDLSFWTHPEFTTESNRLNCQRGMLNAIHSADGLVFISENSQRDFYGIFPNVERVQKVPTIVLPLASRFPILQEARPSFDSGPWLSIGALEPRKNFDLLLDAFEIYQRESQSKRQLVLAGGKGWKSEGTWTRLKELQRAGVVQHRGYISDSELQALYEHAFGFVFPSHYEGFGLPILEAMSQGCPVISARNSSLLEVGGEAVSYWDGKSAATLAEAMLRLEQNEEIYLRQSKKGLLRARLFSWERTALELRQFYDSVLEDL